MTTTETAPPEGGWRSGMPNPEEQLVADLVEELRRGDIPAVYQHTGGGIMCCQLEIQPDEDGERVEWLVGLGDGAEEPWGFDIILWPSGDLLTEDLGPAWQARAGWGPQEGASPAGSDSVRDVARWLMDAVTDLHGPTPNFI
jgi:hypothetical protein